MLSTLGAQFILVLIFFISADALAILDTDVDATITIPLNKTVPLDNREIYGDFLKLNGSSIVKVNFTDIDTNFTFIIFQVHSQFYKITLYQESRTNTTQLNGTNVGLLDLLEPLPDGKLKADTFYIQNPHTNITLRVYFSVHGYDQYDPIPGGCNLVYPVPITPYMMVKENYAYVTVDTAPPSIDANCDIVNNATVEFYMMYLPEMNFYLDDYFSGIRNMMTLKNINKSGTLLPSTHWPQRRLLSAYPGTGVVFVAVAIHSDNERTRFSIYVPNHSYGCTKMDEGGCELTDDMLSQILCAMLLFIGLFVSFFGHRFFKTEMFLSGFFSGFVISYILVNLMKPGIDTPALVAASAMSGVFFGAIWLLFWWLYGIPVVAVSLVGLNVGFVLASIFYNSLPVVSYMKDDLNFWAVFTMVMFLTALALVSVTYEGNILCCAALGGFATMYACDYLFGASIRYIMINIVRRAIVPNFNLVVLSPPYMWRDILVTILGVMVAILGWTFQHWYNVGRPPFPPPPRSTRPAAPDHNFMYGAVTDEIRQPNRNIRANVPRVTPLPAEPSSYDERTHLLVQS